MNVMIHKLAIRISEGFQTTEAINEKAYNMFHRHVVQHQSHDLSFINGIAETGLRASAYIPGSKLMSNFSQLSYAARQHLPIILHTSSHMQEANGSSNGSIFKHIKAVQSCGFFQFIAHSLEEDIYLTLAAHKIAELSLIPGMIISDYDTEQSEMDLPLIDKIIQFLSNPDDKISSPTPSQTMIFGKTRRRIPNWYSLDLPTMLAPSKDSQGISFEAAANEQFFHRHLQEIIDSVFNEIELVFQVSLSPLSTFGKSAKNGMIILGGSAEQVQSNLLISLSKTECAKIIQFSPFPRNAMKHFIKDKRNLSFIEPVLGENGSHTSPYTEIASLASSSKTKLYRARYQGQLSDEKIRWAHQHMISDEKVLDYYVGLEFARKHSLYPKQEILLQEIVSNYPEIEKISVGGNDVLPGISTLKPVEMPLALRKIKDKGPKYSQLSRYNDQTAFLYAKGEQNNLVADPYSALALVPQAGSALFNSKDAKETLPILDVSKCTGCGDCISVCPQLAIRPVVSSVESLMQTGMSLVASKGVNITRLTPMLKNMGKLAGSVFAESAGTDAAELLTDVFNNLCNQMKISGDSLTPLKAEFALVLEEIGEMPVALTDSFYFEQNAIEKGRGELFSLAIDPDLCTSCELCSSNCEEKALQMLSRDETILAKAKKQNKLWENMPDVLPDTIERLFQEKEYSKASALLLSRNYANTLVGVNENRKTDPVKQMMHLITASAESVVQPKLVNQIKQVDELLQKLSDQAHKMLNEAIPNDSLELLNEAIAETHDRKLSFKQIFEKFRDEGHGKLIDREDMQRKLALIDSLKRLKGMLSEGPSGLGRSRFGLMIDGTELFDWASTYPMNPFLNPTVIQRSGDIAEQAMGLFYGQLRYILDNIKLIRRANLEISNKYNPSLHDKLIANLSWEDLSDDEKNAIPPILLIVDHRQIIENAWSGLFNLLSGNFPLKIFALNTLHFDINNPRVDYDRMNASIWSIIGLKRVFVYQGSLANMDGLCSSVMIGLNRVDPAFFHLYVSDPELHASKKVNWLPFADLANSSRSFPEITFDPHHHKSFLHEAIEIDKNPEVRDNWTRTGLPGEDDEIIEYKISWADWIFTYKSWQKEFKQSDYQENFIPVAEYLELETAQKSDRSPVIIRRGKEGLNYYKVSDKVVQMTREVLNNWRSLQEFAGYISPFAEKLRKELNAQSEKEFEDKIAMLKKSHEEELNNLEAEHLEKIREQLKQKLVTLSKMAKN